jgi:hypothetical protein
VIYENFVRGVAGRYRLLDSALILEGAHVLYVGETKCVSLFIFIFIHFPRRLDVGRMGFCHFHTNIKMKILWSLFTDVSFLLRFSLFVKCDRRLLVRPGFKWEEYD